MNHNYEINFQFPERYYALEFLARLDEAIDDFGQITVSDLLEMLGEADMDMSENTKRGWTSMMNGFVIDEPFGGYYVLVLPEPEELEVL